jgi:hypothetical protein
MAIYNLMVDVTCRYICIASLVYRKKKKKKKRVGKAVLFGSKFVLIFVFNINSYANLEFNYVKKTKSFTFFFFFFFFEI